MRERKEIEGDEEHIDRAVAEGNASSAYALWRMSILQLEVVLDLREQNERIFDTLAEMNEALQADRKNHY